MDHQLVSCQTFEKLQLEGFLIVLSKRYVSYIVYNIAFSHKKPILRTGHKDDIYFCP